ncbi:MAG: hypothetical protein CVU51_02610 [Deltaproteobacteria bacterium HGW-Deltaproteobacteria-1]|nr:MAG: hypothetical protein CVU51_02610 [Deltaproteobacteria bacterium HGW-Deltaproteobacteria-1]
MEKIKINYKGKKVTAHKLIVSSEIPIDINTAWEKVQTSALLEFVIKGKLKFKPAGGSFPEIWKQGSTVKARMNLYGVIPFGGVHTLVVEEIDNKNKVIQSREWDDFAKVWDHRISLKKLSDSDVHYEDEIIIYGGLLTGLISLWAKSFYKHRQRRWQLVARESAGQAFN